MKTSKISLQLLANTLTTLSEQDSAEALAKSDTDMLSVHFDQPTLFDLGETKVIPFTFTGKPTSFEIPETPYGWTIMLHKMNEFGGTLAITASNFCIKCTGTLSIILSNGISSVKQLVVLSLNPHSIPIGTICYDENEPVGIVFRSKTSTQKGLVVHKKHTRAAWGCPKTLTYAVDRDNGLNNVNRIESISATFEEFPSFCWCHMHGDHWYMPSLHELLKLFDSKDEVNSHMYEIKGIPLATDNAAYWASNEVNDSFAWSVYFQDGHLNYHKKEYEKLVRAIRAF